MIPLVAKLYALMLDVEDPPVVIVGGGGVALRKATGLLEAGAMRVKCIAPRIIAEMPAGVQRVEREYHHGDLAGAGVVFAATDRPEVNEAVVREARERGILVSRADADEENAGGFSTPAVSRHGAVIVAVSAGGSPRLAARIRDDLAAKVDGRMVEMATVMQRLRPAVIASAMSSERRRALFSALADDEALNVLATLGADGLWQWACGQFAELKQISI